MSDHSEWAIGAIRTIHDFWQVESDCVEWVGDTDPDSIFKQSYGFDWWPGDFKVSVRVSGPHPEIEEPYYRLSVRTDYLRDVDVTTTEFANGLSDLNRFAPLFANCSHPPAIQQLADQYGIPKSKLALEFSKVWLSSVAYVSESSKEWLPHWFAGVTVLQPIEAQFRAEHSISWLGSGKVDRSSPVHKVRTGLDGMLGVEQEIAAYGQHQSKWIGTGEFEEIIDKWGRTETTLGIADQGTLLIETPFGDETAMAQLLVGEPHPRLGNGLLGLLKIPVLSDQEAAEALSIDLNYLENLQWQKIGFPFLGSWAAEKIRVIEGVEYFAPTFGCFIPNLTYQPGIAEHVALWLLVRARWVRQSRLPDVIDDSLEAIISRRLNLRGLH